MEARLSTEMLRKAFVDQKELVSSKSAQGLLSNSHMVAGNSTIIVTSTNFECWVEHSIPSAVSNRGKAEGIAVPTSVVADLLSALDCETLLIKSTEKDNLSITAPNKPYRINGITGSEFPAMPDNSGDKSVVIDMDQQTLKKCINKTVFAADDLRPMLQGINIIVSRDKITFVATDTKVIAICEVKCEFNYEANIILPQVAARQMVRIIGEAGEMATLELSNNSSRLFVPGITLHTRNVYGQYPLTSAVIPNEYSVELEIDKKEIAGAMRRLATLFSKTETQKVKFLFSNGMLSAEAIGAGYGDACESIAAKQTNSGSMESTAFNIKWFSHIISSIDSDVVVFKINHGKRPSIIIPYTKNGELPEGGISQLYGIMPMTMQ